MTSQNSISTRGHTHPTLSLAQLCRRVMAFDVAFEDIRDAIEMQAHEEAESGSLSPVLCELERLCSFFEGIRKKSEEISRDLADVYLLMGDVCRDSGSSSQSIAWYEKAIVVDDSHPAAYRSLSAGLIELGEYHRAIRCIEQELHLAPGNLTSYLTLASLYDSTGEAEKMERCLEELLTRDPGNVHALDRLIRHHRIRSPEVETGFLRRRLLLVSRELTETEFLVRICHLCEEERYHEALQEITRRESIRPEATHALLRAHIHLKKGETAAAERKMAAFAVTVTVPKVRDRAIREFAGIFGDAAAQQLSIPG